MEPDLIPEAPEESERLNIEGIELATGAFQNLHNFMKIPLILQQKDMDVIMPVSSFKGMGKSNWALEASRVYIEDTYNPLFKKDFKIERDLRRIMPRSSDMDAIMENIENPENDYLPLINDEAIDNMSSDDWARTENKKLKRVITKARPHHRIIMPCIPSFFWLDRKYREDMVFFWVHLPVRGTGLIFTIDCKIGINDRWHKKQFEEIKEKVNIFSDADKYLRLYRKHPCFLDSLSVSKASERLYSKYLAMRAEDVAKAEQPVKKPKQRRINLGEVVRAMELLKKGLSTFDVAQKLDYHEDVISQWRREVNSYLSTIADDK